MLCQAIAVIGTLAVGWQLYKLARLLAAHFSAPTNLARFGANKAKPSAAAWAVVTGASDGIGREFSVQLAAKGFNVALVSRTRAKLDAVAADIKAATPAAQTRIVAVDFAAADTDEYTRVVDELRGLDVGVLVNNVGVSYAHPEWFAALPVAQVRAMIDVNVRAANELTHALLPRMVERRRGLVVNLSSFAGSFPMPLYTIYSASKAYMRTWSTALAGEYAAHGVVVECHSPYYVTGTMTKIRRPSLMVPSPAQYVHAALAKAGKLTDGNPHLPHALATWLLATLPEALKASLVVGQLKTIRKKAIARAEREAAAAKK